jgi:hypothetical protein
MMFLPVIHDGGRHGAAGSDTPAPGITVAHDTQVCHGRGHGDG